MLLASDRRLCHGPQVIRRVVAVALVALLSAACAAPSAPGGADGAAMVLGLDFLAAESASAGGDRLVLAAAEGSLWVSGAVSSDV